MKFIILCYPRTGSTLFITALGTHPKISQGMEIFNPELEGDAPWVDWRKKTLKTLYGFHDSYLNAQGYLDGQRFDLSLLSREFFKAFDGTKIMYDQLEPSSQVWDHIKSLKDLRIIILTRNIIEAAVSFRIALESNIWHVPNQETLPASPSLIYQPDYFEWFFNHFCSSEEFFRNLFKNQTTMTLDYQDLVDHWENRIFSAQAYLGLEPIHIPMMFKKRTQGKIEELISNYHQIRKYYEKHPVLAHHFEKLS